MPGAGPEKGADDMPWHGTSEYAHSSHFRALDRNDRARWRFRLHTAHRHGWISRAARDVAEALLRHHAESGRCDPSHERLARFADCTARTVLNALRALRACGLVGWTRRIVRTAAGARQTSSAYRLLLAGLDALAQRRKPDRKACGGTMKKEILGERSDLEGARRMAAEATKSLTQIAQERAAALAAMWRGKRA